MKRLTFRVILCVGYSIGGIVGYITSSTILSLSASAANASLVCFAEAPDVLSVYHPKLSKDLSRSLKEAWATPLESSLFSGECDIEFCRMTDEVCVGTKAEV